MNLTCKTQRERERRVEAGGADGGRRRVEVVYDPGCVQSQGSGLHRVQVYLLWDVGNKHVIYTVYNTSYLHFTGVYYVCVE